MREHLPNEIAKYHWWHSIDFGGGVITPGVKTSAIHRQESASFFDRVQISGQSVLDIGAWNGFYSFEAKRRGAQRVLATDKYVWTHENFRGRETFELARRTLGLDVEALEIDPSDISSESVGEFDIVLFLGVFYHRYDAIDALARAARVAKQLLIVETHLDFHKVDRPAMAFYPPGRKPHNDETNWWGPNVPCMKELLLGHGFAEIEISASEHRGLFHAWRSTALRRIALPEKERWKPGGPGIGARIIRQIRRPLRPR
jgi:tRNA (mo5U34)-methyltransferase